MLSVSIAVNGESIYARTAVNQGKQASGFTKYLIDEGSTILHKPDDGAVALAIKMLKTIKEPTSSRRPNAHVNDPTPLEPRKFD